METSRRRFVKTLFAAGQAGLFGRFLMENSLAAAPTESDALNFLVLGDWGVKGKTGQTQVAAQMGRVAAATGAKFVIAVGDNFYEAGVQDVHDPQWQTSFTQVYTAPALQIPWYAVLGNHDYGGNCQAQLDYGKTSSRWIMPARYYTQIHPLGSGGTVQFFYLDTCPFVQEYRTLPALPAQPTEENLKEQVIRQTLRDHLSGQDAAQQLAWLASTLAASRADWKIAVGHHPVYSGGAHGNQPELIEQFLPLFHRYGVQVYLCGHDHDLQHLQSEGIDFLCSGAGGAELYPLHANPASQFARQTFGFISLSLQKEKMEVRMIDQKGKVVYPTSILRRA